MNLKRILRAFVIAVALIGVTSAVGSCSKDNSGDGDSAKKGQIVGVITGDENVELSGVEISLSKISSTGLPEKEAFLTGVSQADGKYSFNDVPISSYVATFVKLGYQTVSMTITPPQFKDGVLDANVKMEVGGASISGTVLDAKNGNAPLAGVSVSVGAGAPATTDADGKYTIENLLVDDYTLTFSKVGYAVGKKTMSKIKFVNSKATLDFVLGAPDLLRGKTINDLQDADIWLYNEYKGGRNGQDGWWDWSLDFMGTFSFSGTWEEQNEGTTIQIRNSSSDQSNNPIDLNMFDSYVFGRKRITADNKIMTLLLRSHQAVTYGVQVIDISSATPTAVKIGVNTPLNSGDYLSHDYDLSPYIGKDVVIAIGTYRTKTGDNWGQLVLRRIAFAATKVNDFKMLPGTPVAGLDEWLMTMEMVRSTMVNSNKKFTGISPVAGNRDNYIDGYKSWRGISHIASEWSLVPVRKDTEPFSGEGFVIKTRGDSPVNTKRPEAYFYTKFAIADGNNKFTLNIRNFSANATFFKVTAIEETGTVNHLSPISNTATSASAANDGCWKFVNNNGDKNNPKGYASFVYDLSQFNGKNVVLTIGVFKGEGNGDESKICFYSMSIN